jgi:hypothetical protein
VFWFQGLKKSQRLSGTFVVRLLQPPAWPALSTGLTGVTGLTGAGHRSDWCSTSSKPCKFPLCVLGCFGLEGCLLVPRISSTPVAMSSWPTWVVESETCVGSRVHLVGVSIFEKNFYQLPSTPPLWFAVSVLQRWEGRVIQELLSWTHQKLTRLRLNTNDNQQSRAFLGT